MKTLADLQPGDEVIIYRYGRNIVGKIERKTDTQLIVSEDRYRIRDGMAIGSRGFHRGWIRLLEDGEKESIEKENRENHLRTNLKYQDWRECSLETLEAINALIEKEEADRKAKAEGGR